MSAEHLLFYGLLMLWSLVATYWIIFKILPGFTKKEVHVAHTPTKQKGTHARPQHSTHDGFRAYARNGELTVEDIVKALSRED